MGRPKKQKLSKVENKSSGTQVKFLGIGSYNVVKNKKTSKGIFWTLEDNTIYLIDARESKYIEQYFTSYEDFINYCNKTFKNFVIAT